MADRFARASAAFNTVIWSDVPTGGSTNASFNPTASDVCYANGYTVSIPTSITVSELRSDVNGSGATGSGGFTCSVSDVVINTTNIVSGATPVLSTSSASGTIFIVGNILGGTSTNSYGVNNTSTGIVRITGNITGNATNWCCGIYNNNGGNLIVTGNVSGGTGVNCYGITNRITGSVIVNGNIYGISNNAYGIDNQSTGTITVNNGNVYGNLINGINNLSAGTITINNGNVYGGTAATAYGINNAGLGILNVTGNVYGGTAATAYGINNASYGSVIINGTVQASSYSTATNNASTGLMIVNGTVVGNEFGKGSSGCTSQVGLSASQTGVTYVKAVKYGSRGQSPTSGPIFFLQDPELNSVSFVTDALSSYVNLYRQDKSSQNQALISDVRKGTVYAGGTRTGTCNIPLPSQVAIGTPIDNTIGTAVITAASAETAFLNHLKYKKSIIKIASTWYLVIRDANDTVDLVRKPLKDKNGADITDYAAGVMTTELGSVI